MTKRIYATRVDLDNLSPQLCTIVGRHLVSITPVTSSPGECHVWYESTSDAPTEEIEFLVTRTGADVEDEYTFFHSLCGENGIHAHIFYRFLESIFVTKPTLKGLDSVDTMNEILEATRREESNADPLEYLATIRIGRDSKAVISKSLLSLDGVFFTLDRFTNLGAQGINRTIYSLVKTGKIITNDHDIDGSLFSIEIQELPKS